MATYFNNGFPKNNNDPNNPIIKRVDRNRSINPNVFNPNPQAIRTNIRGGLIPQGQPEKKI